MGSSKNAAGRLPAALAALLACGCASVPPGHAAVVTWPSAGVDPEARRGGNFFVGPFTQVETLDLREQQERDANFIATLADGARVQTGASLVTYRYAPDELVSLLREVGPSPYAAVISPLIQSTVRRVLGALVLEELDTPHLRQAQRDITRIAAARLRPLHILLDDVDLRQVAPISRALNRAIVGTGVMEQSTLRAPDDLKLAAQRAQARRAEAAGIVDAHAALLPTLDERALEDLRARAWQQLLAAPSTRAVVLDSATTVLEISP